MSVLNNSALLVSLKVSQWAARKYDKKATQTVADAHNLKGSVGRYNKSLLPEADALLKVVNTRFNEVRTFYYINTVPWGQEGSRLLPAANYLQFSSKIGSLISNANKAVDDFVNVYPELKDKAKIVLGPLYDEADYPTPARLRAKFNADVAVFPVPSADIRCQLIDSEVSKIEADIQHRLEEASKIAMSDVWNRLHAVTSRMAERLSDPDAKFHKTLVTNVQEVCSLLTRLNFTDDPNLEALRQEVEAKLSGHDPEELRHDMDLRKDVAQDAKDIMAKMGAFMGAV